MPRGKAANKSKSKRALEAEKARDLPGQAAWGEWFRPHSSSSHSQHVTERSIVAQIPSIEDEETQDPNMGSEATQDDITHEVYKRKRTRGPNKVIPTPANPTDRILITTLHDEKFVDPRIVRTITKSIQLNFSDAWPTWKKIPDATKEEMWKNFQEKTMWPIEKGNIVHKIWETTCKERLRGMMEEERTRAMKRFEVDDIAKCIGYNAGWIRVDIWDRLVANVWSTAEWKNKSVKAKQNRNTEKEGSITKHTGGSIPFVLHAEKMAKEFNRRPTYGELFDRTHKRDKGQGNFVDNKSKFVSETYSSSMTQKYGPDETNHPEFDQQAWCEAIGGIETTRTNVYGFGTTPRGKNIFSESINAGSASYSACSPTVENRATPIDENNQQDINMMKDRLLNLENNQENIMKYLHNITEMLNPKNMFSNFSIGPSQPAGTDGDNSMQGP